MKQDRIIVISGGGARGAWGAGFAKYLSKNFRYRYGFGTSTGSLMIPLIVQDKFDDLKTVYTSVSQRDIFSVNPFNEKTGELIGFKAVWRLVWGKQTFGESKNLRNLIERFLPDTQYQSIIDPKNRTMFAVSVVDMDSGSLELKYSSSISDPSRMKDWIWASANEPLFMSYYNVGPAAYVDGGVRENVPIVAALQFAVKHNSTEPDKIFDIDVVVNKPEDPLINTSFKHRGIFRGLVRLIDIWLMEVRKNDVEIAQLRAQAEIYTKSTKSFIDEPKYHIHLHYFPKELFTGLNQKELLFNKQRMTTLWDAGESGQKDENKFIKEVLTIPASMLTKMFK